MTAPPYGSPSRTLFIDGRPRPPLPLAWQNMNAGDVLDYTVDYSAWLLDAYNGQSSGINSASIAVSVQGDGQLTIVSQNLVGAQLIFILSGGTAGQLYQFSVTVGTTASPALTLTLPVNLTVNPAAPS
jgi:hypothetical protein